MVDYLLTRPDVDPARLALIGYSAGRYFAPRTGSFQHARWSLGIQKPHEWPAAYAPFTLKGLEDHFRNPMLFLFREDDIQSSAAATPEVVVGLLKFIQARFGIPRPPMLLPDQR